MDSNICDSSAIGECVDSTNKEIKEVLLNQNDISKKIETLTENVEGLRDVVAKFSEKITEFEDLGPDQRKLRNDVKVLKNRIDELFAIVKDGKEEESVASDVQEIESCHSGASCASKVRFFYYC